MSAESLTKLIRDRAKWMKDKAPRNEHSEDWYNGFLEGMEHVAKYIIPEEQKLEQQEGRENE